MIINSLPRSYDELTMMLIFERSYNEFMTKLRQSYDNKFVIITLS